MQNAKMGKTSVTKHALNLGAMFGLVLGTLFAPTPASAQRGSPSTDVPVQMVVTAKPHHGGQAPAIAPDDVKVYQKGKLNTVTSWVPLQGDRAGLQLFILIDDTSRDSLSLQFSSIKNFINEQPASTAIGVGYMRNGAVYTAQEFDDRPCPRRKVAALAVRRFRWIHQPLPRAHGPDEEVAGDERSSRDIDDHQRNRSPRRRIFQRSIQ